MLVCLPILVFSLRPDQADQYIISYGILVCIAYYIWHIIYIHPIFIYGNILYHAVYYNCSYIISNHLWYNIIYVVIIVISNHILLVFSDKVNLTGLSILKLELVSIRLIIVSACAWPSLITITQPQYRVTLAPGRYTGLRWGDMIATEGILIRV